MARYWGTWFDNAARSWRRGTWQDRLALGRGMELASVKLQQDAVNQAREEGASWTSIGLTIGITRQAAWERFGTG